MIRKVLAASPPTIQLARAAYERTILRIVDPREHARRAYLQQLRRLARLIVDADLSPGMINQHGEFFIKTVDDLWLHFNYLEDAPIEGDGQSLHFRSSQLQQPLERYLLDRLGDGSVYIDVGANNGYFYALKAAKRGKCSAIYAFEPDPAILHYLKRNIEVNRLTERIEVIDEALTDHVGEALLTNNRMAMAYVTDDSRIGAVQIRCNTLDGVVRERSLQAIHMIKVDVEGGEHAFLRGARSTLEDLRPVLVLEVIDELLRRQGSSERELLDELRRLGYVAKRALGTHDVVAHPAESSDTELDEPWLQTLSAPS